MTYIKVFVESDDGLSKCVWLFNVVGEDRRGGNTK